MHLLETINLLIDTLLQSSESPLLLRLIHFLTKEIRFLSQIIHFQLEIRLEIHYLTIVTSMATSMATAIAAEPTTIIPPQIIAETEQI